MGEVSELGHSAVLYSHHPLLLLMGFLGTEALARLLDSFP